MPDLDAAALIAAFRVNHHPDAEPSSVELAQLSRSITAYLAALHSTSGVKVRELEWPDTIKRGQRVTSSGGLLEYTIAHYGGSQPDSGVVYRWAIREGAWSEPYFAYEHAISDAQSDYDRRIRSALSPSGDDRMEPVGYVDGTRLAPIKHYTRATSLVISPKAFGRWVTPLYTATHPNPDRIAELEKALEPFTKGNVDVSGTAVILGYPQAQQALDAARRAKGGA